MTGPESAPLTAEGGLQVRATATRARASSFTPQQIKQLERQSRRENRGRLWYKFSRNPLSVIGLVVLVLIGLAAGIAPHITPFPEQAGAYTDFENAGKPPSWTHLFGTDRIGRDVFTRGHAVSFSIHRRPLRR